MCKIATLLSGFVLAIVASAALANPVVELETDLGPIKVELYEKEAPVTVDNFLTYVKDGFYNGTLFHRVIPGFMIQGGGLTFDFVEKETRDPIINESDNGIPNKAGTIAMARTADPNSATAQFYINVADNTHLDDAGYAVFGEVIDGWEVIDEILAQPRGQYSEFPHAPNQMVRILEAKVVEE
ncbi:peptidyl-prolyl cis-trans isomerase [Proteobacteria bacterium 005FR1]|nr:peptidyl-prolyl cis-trans isomerase [Proteobacteria bacterium 005FR1]